MLCDSNVKEENGLQDRRNAEVLLLNTYERRIVQLRGKDQINKEIFGYLKNRIQNTLDEIKAKY